MAVLKMLDNKAASFPEGAYCSLAYRPGKDSYPVVLVEEYKGLCVEEREANYYDDSDFYMKVWSPVSKSAFEVCFATTRGWSYPCYASAVDAGPEVMAEYKAWKAREARKFNLLNKRAVRKGEFKAAAKAGLSRGEYLRLAAVYGRGSGNMDSVLKLLGTKAFRSAFRESLAKQVRAWLAGSSKYASPLSPKQLMYV